MSSQAIVAAPTGMSGDFALAVDPKNQFGAHGSGLFHPITEFISEPDILLAMFKFRFTQDGGGDDFEANVGVCSIGIDPLSDSDDVYRGVSLMQDDDATNPLELALFSDASELFAGDGNALSPATTYDCLWYVKKSDGRNIFWTSTGGGAWVTRWDITDTTDDDNGMENIKFGGVDKGEPVDGGLVYYDDICVLRDVDDSPPFVDCVVADLKLTADGADQAWTWLGTGSPFADWRDLVDEPQDGTVNDHRIRAGTTTESDGDKVSFGFANPTGTELAVQIEGGVTVSFKAAAGTHLYRLFLSDGAGTYDNGPTVDQHVPTPAFTHTLIAYHKVWETFNGGALDLDGLEIGMEAVTMVGTNTRIEVGAMAVEYLVAGSLDTPDDFPTTTVANPGDPQNYHRQVIH